ncbi:MAG: hypothetical protein KC733_02195, partial [Candidatus Omnitrophica bacterium]|nr:hypothetical protein [Candidatus Omnitrophota bacterium]
MNEKLKVILKKNAEYEQQTPYNFCDRWCERCNPETQRRCQLYLDELGLQLTNIAHGRDPEDIEIFEEDLDMLTPDVDILEDSWLDDDELEDEFDDDETLQTIERQRRELSTHPLMKVVKQYQLLTSRFLNKNYFDKIYPEGKIPYNFETISWYHTLLP